jgi:hypothetical protein
MMDDTNNIVESLKKQKDAALSIKGVASEVNMISINAAIESAHAASGIRSMMEKVLDGLMTSICRLFAVLLETHSVAMDCYQLDELAKRVGIDELYITDSDGVTVASNLTAALGWRFPDDPKAQAFAFRSLIHLQDGVVTQPITARSLDSQMYKFVGVSRTDEPGIVQIGFRAETITRYQVEIGSVFGILATEIKNLGNKVSTASKTIMEVTAEMEKTLQS